MSIDNKTHRPWGWYETLHGDDKTRTKIKKIHINPQKRLSLQSHKYRHEHWIIEEGNPHVQVGDSFTEMEPNKHIYIPLGYRHRIENNTDSNVVLIEVQYGDYLGEDDITRYDDDYGRA